MAKGFKPIFPLNMVMFCIFYLHDEVSQMHRFPPISLQSSKISAKSVNLYGVFQSFLTLTASTRKSIYFSRQLTDTKNAHRNYIDYRVRSKTRKNNFNIFIKYIKLFKQWRKTVFPQKKKNWRDEKKIPSGKILILYNFIYPMSI